MPTLWELLNPQAQMTVDPSAMPPAPQTTLPAMRATPEQQEFWRAWYPNEPYVGSLPQQQEMVRLQQMQEKNLELLDTPQRNPVFSQDVVPQTNAAAMAAEPTIGPDGSVVMPPLLAVAPLLETAGPGMDAPGGLQATPTGGSAAPTAASIGWSVDKMPGQGKAGVEAPSGMQAGAPAGAPVAPGQQAPQQAPQQMPVDPPSKWKVMLDELRKPEVYGPLQTFFSALAAPLAPWETPGSRLGRANMLMTMHKSMLDENARTQPMRDELEQLTLREKRAGVTGKEADTRGKLVEADVAEATRDSQIAKALEDLRAAELNNDLKGVQIAKAQLEERLLRLYGDEEKAAEIFAKLSNVKYQQGMLGVAQRNAATAEKNANRATKENADILASSAQAYDVEIWQPYQKWHKQTWDANPGADVSFDTFLAENPVKAARYKAIMDSYVKAGGQVQTRRAEGAAAGSGRKANYTLDAQGNLK